jgi:oligosaccharyltransferase complex subunit alpha (ribophorin I)
VEEQYQIENIGAKLDGEFGRIDYDENSRTGGKNALTELTAKLPLRAWGLWYRDEIGNISTSIAKREWNDVDLYLKPRFPILGGWKTNFGIGYNLPSKFHINTDGNNYMLNLTFGMPFNDILAREFMIEVDLPEGAFDIKLNLPIKGKYKVENKNVKGCLDLIGRNAVVIKLKNVYDIHKVNFQILYKYNESNLYKKPMIIICYFLAIFLSLIVYMRADLSLNKNKEKVD